MGLFKSFVDALGYGKPEGPYCKLEDLELDWEEYEKHIEKARELLFSTLSDERWTLVTKEYKGKSPTDLLSKVRWEYLPNVKIWVADEFIPKIRQYRKANASEQPSGVLSYRRSVIEHGDECPVMDAKNHLVNSRHHRDKIATELHFFLCDGRSPFDQKASLYNGDCTAQDLVRWYVHGKHIVERNMKLIDETLTEYIEFAYSKGAK